MQCGDGSLSLNFEVGKSESFEAKLLDGRTLNVEVLSDMIWGDEENHELCFKVLFKSEQQCLQVAIGKVGKRYNQGASTSISISDTEFIWQILVPK